MDYQKLADDVGIKGGHGHTAVQIAESLVWFLAAALLGGILLIISIVIGCMQQ